MSGDPLRELLGRLAGAANAISALGVALAARAAGTEVAVGIRAPVAEVLATLGVHDAVAAASPAAARALLGEIRVTLLQAAARVRAAGPSLGWTSGDPELLQAAGDVSAAFPLLVEKLARELSGLGERLERAGRFLDVGVGVGALSIEMARRWPGLAVVGIDVWAPALALARANVARAGLDARIELREQPAEELTDVAAFDLAWIPSAFLPGEVIGPALERVRRALRPGGWLLFASLALGRDPLAAALARLRSAEWGGVARDPGDAEQLLARHGFTHTRALPAPSGALTAFVVGRAPD